MTCERCWKLAGGNATRYQQLLVKEHCTPEQQAGDEAATCPHCQRQTVHQYCRVCVICGRSGEAQEGRPHA